MGLLKTRSISIFIVSPQLHSAMDLILYELRMVDGCVSCRLKTSSAPVAARFRTALMMDVAFPAIADVRIDDNNNTLLTTWEIEQRLSMIRVDVDRPLNHGDQPCIAIDPWSCSVCSTNLVLCAENKRESDIISVTAASLAPESDEIVQATVTYEGTEVIRLAPGESISLNALVRCGTGREDVRYQRISKVSLVPADRDHTDRKYDGKSGTPSETDFFCEFKAYDDEEARHSVLSAMSTMMRDGVTTRVVEG